MSYHKGSRVLAITTMMRKRLNLRMAATAPANVMAFLGVKCSGVTLRVPVTVAKVKMKSHRTLVMQLSAGDARLWTRAKAHLYGEGKCQLSRLELFHFELMRVYALSRSTT